MSMDTTAIASVHSFGMGAGLRSRQRLAITWHGEPCSQARRGKSHSMEPKTTSDDAVEAL